MIFIHFAYNKNIFHFIKAPAVFLKTGSTSQKITFEKQPVPVVVKAGVSIIELYTGKQKEQSINVKANSDILITLDCRFIYRFMFQDLLLILPVLPFLFNPTFALQILNCIKLLVLLLGLLLLVVKRNLQVYIIAKQVRRTDCKAEPTAVLIHN